jgi:hypothetical protein
MRLLFGHAYGCQCVENRPTFHFQLTCQIVDSNFVHPSLFASPARLAVHISLIEVGLCVASIISEAGRCRSASEYEHLSIA